MTQTYTIATLSKEFGITPRTLRFYESKGILNPGRKGTTRLYTERDRVRLMLTLRGKRLGFSLEECNEIIEMYNSSQSDDTRQLIRLCQKIREHRAQLLGKMKSIEETLNAMDEMEEKCLKQLFNNSTRTP
jgi:DNA-binding transcriptional MerR regulator